MGRKPQKSPTQLGVKDFLGSAIVDGLIKGRESERKAIEHRVKPVSLIDILAETGMPSPNGPEFWAGVRSWWPINLLRETAKAGDREGYKRLLHLFLCELDARPPEGVLTAFSWPKGRPPIALNAAIGKQPRLTVRVKNQIAKELYPEEYRRADELPDVKLMARLRRRVDAAIRRRRTRATKCT